MSTNDLDKEFLNFDMCMIEEQLTYAYMEYFTFTDYITLIINLLLFIFAKKLISRTDTDGKILKNHSIKVFVLRSVSALLFLAYIIAFFSKLPFAESWSQSYLILASAYLINHKISEWILFKYGDHEKVDEHVRVTDNYLSQILRLSVASTFIVATFILLIQIWDLKSLIETGGFFAMIGLVLFATKDFWLEEILASFTIHAKGKLKRGTVIQLSDNNYYVILETNFINTRLKDLKTDVESNIPNANFIRGKINILSIEKSSSNGDESISANIKKNKRELKPTKQFLHFNIGYDVEYEVIKEYFNSVMAESLKRCNALGSNNNGEANYSLNVHNNGDHAVTWEVIYYLTTPFQVLNVKNMINLVAYEKQKEFNISLSTPLTHVNVG